MAGWPVEPVWTFTRGKNLLSMPVIKPRFLPYLVGNIANIPTDCDGIRLMRVSLYKYFTFELLVMNCGLVMPSTDMVVDCQKVRQLRRK
jgi:hypothetical protein